MLLGIYTNGLISFANNCYIIKYAEDTAILGLVTNNDETSYIAEIDHCTSWCEHNNLLLNSTKTKELIFDFRKCEQSYAPVIIGGSEVERVDKFKYLGTTIDNKLTWSDHFDTVLSKFHQRLYFLRILRTFGIDNSILHMFYSSVVESIVLFNLLTYWSSLNSGQKDITIKLQKRVSKITGITTTPIEEHFFSKCITKKLNISYQTIFIHYLTIMYS